jgi:hypothetical protein
MLSCAGVAEGFFDEARRDCHAGTRWSAKNGMKTILGVGGFADFGIFP